MHNHARDLEAAGWRRNDWGRWIHPNHKSNHTVYGSLDWGFTIMEAIVRSGIRLRK